MPKLVPEPLATGLPNELAQANDDPIALFQSWLREATEAGTKEPTAMSLATVEASGRPDVRMVLLKGVDERGFVFYTNLGSSKAEALRRDPRAALCFYWEMIDKQVRIRGRAERVTNQEADTYFASRARLSQIGAWASRQSRPMRTYFELEAEVARMILRFGIGEVPRPDFWSGFRVRPEEIEFWKQKPFRRHQRILYRRMDTGWQKEWLYP